MKTNGVKNIFYYGFIFFLLFAALLAGCTRKNKDIRLNDFEKVKHRGKLIAVTQNNSTDYFIYRGEPMGYQLELLQSLADYLNTELEVIVKNDMNESFNALENGECDLIAMNLVINKPRSDQFSFTLPIGQSRQVLIQRKPIDYKEISNEEIESSLIRDQVDLGNKVIYVIKGSAASHRLKNLAEEIGKEITVIEVPEYEEEQLIKMVSDGTIDYTVAHEDVAKVAQKYYENIDINTPVSFPQNIAWAVNKKSQVLLDTINSWVSRFKDSQRHKMIYSKYFNNDKSVIIVNSEYYSNISGKVSEYDKYIKQESKELNWDWRLLASLICQESRFKSDAVSWAGAFGIMQLMPSTANGYGITKTSSAEAQISAGVKYIKWISNKLQNDSLSGDEKIKFILAAYNAGIGHIYDARKLAVKYGMNPNRWNDVSYFIINKSDPKFYHDPEVKFGYFRGEETCAYVQEVLERYSHYKNIISEN